MKDSVIAEFAADLKEPAGSQKDWDIKEFFDQVREASLKDPIVAKFAADLREQNKVKTKERYAIKFKKRPPPVKKS